MKKYTLRNENINAAVQSLETFLVNEKTQKQSLIRIQLAVEEILLKYQEVFGEKAVFSYQFKKQFRSARIDIAMYTPQFDPMADVEEEYSEVLRSILSGMNAIPEWRYKSGANYISFTLQRKKISQPVTLIAAVIAAILAGMLCSLMPEHARLLVRDDVLNPVFGAFMGLLSAISGPIIFLSVAWGIYSIGDTATFGKIGKRMIVRFLLALLGVTLLSCAILLPFFEMTGGAENPFHTSMLLDFVLDILPRNLFTPFTEGNPLQIVFVAVVIGVAMLILGDKASAVAAFVDHANNIIRLIMEGISVFMPLIVFCSLLSMFLGNDFSYLTESYKLIPLLILCNLAIMAAHVCMVCIRKRVRPLVFIRKLLPAFLIALTTASSSAAYATNVDCCEKQLGIDRKLVHFGIPLGQTVFMPGVAVLCITAAFCMAEVYGVAISPVWLIMAVFISVILSIANPPVPGGLLSCYTILYLQLGIPDEAVAITIMLNIILDLISTGVNIFCLQAELVELADGVGMLDANVLRSSAGAKE